MSELAAVIGQRVVAIDEDSEILTVTLQDGTVISGELLAVLAADRESPMFRAYCMMRLEARSFANTIECDAAAVQARQPSVASNLFKAARWIRFLNGDPV